MVLTFISKKRIIMGVVFLIVFLFFILHPSPASSRVDTTITPESEAALDEELRWLKAETYVITASRIPEKPKKSAPFVYVITDRQLLRK